MQLLHHVLQLYFYDRNDILSIEIDEHLIHLAMFLSNLLHEMKNLWFLIVFFNL